MGYTYDKVTGQWYETDDKGNMIYTSERPENMTGVYEKSYNTGEMLDDPSTMRSNYIVKNRNDRKGHITLAGRRDRNQAIRSLYQNKDLKTQLFGEDVADYNRRQFRQYLDSDRGRQRLGGMPRKYTTLHINGNVTQVPTRGRFYDNEEVATLANNIINPERKTVDLNIEKGTLLELNGELPKRVPCRHCKNKKASWTKVPWNLKIPFWKIVDDGVKTQPDIEETIVMDEMPLVETEYAAPVPLTPKSEVETRSTGTPSTSTPVPGKTKITIRKGNKSTSKPGLVPRSKVIKTPPTTTVTPPSSQNESRTKTWFELPDGTRINEQFTDWQTQK